MGLGFKGLGFEAYFFSEFKKPWVFIGSLISVPIYYWSYRARVLSQVLTFGFLGFR